MQIGPGGKPVNPEDKDHSVDEEEEQALDQSLEQVGSGLNRQITGASSRPSISSDDFPVSEKSEGSPVTSRTSSISDDKLDFHAPVIYVSHTMRNQISTILEVFFQHHPACLRRSAPETLAKLDPILGPKTKLPQMRKFIKASPENAQATMYYIAGLYASGASELKLWGTTLCYEVIHSHPEVAIDQTNCWAAMEAMSRISELNSTECSQTMEILRQLAAKEYPIASWYLSLVNLGCLKGLPNGDPKKGLEQMLVDVRPLRNPQEHRKQGALRFMDDPLSFSMLDRIPRQPTIEPEPILKELIEQISSPDENDFRYLFLPWLFMALQTGHDAPVTVETYQGVLKSNYPALEFMRECIPVHERLIRYQILFEKHKAQIHREMNKAARQMESRASRFSQRLKKMHTDKLMQAIQDLKTSVRSFKPNFRSADKKRATELLRRIEQDIESADSEYFKALLHFHAGVLCHIQATDLPNQDLIAAGHYIHAGRIGDFVSLLHYCEDTYLAHQMYEEAAEAVSLFSIYCDGRDDEWEEEYRLKAELYRNRAKDQVKAAESEDSPPEMMKVTTTPPDSSEATPEPKHHKSTASSSGPDMDWIDMSYTGAGKSKKKWGSSQKSKKKHSRNKPKNTSTEATPRRKDLPPKSEPKLVFDPDPLNTESPATKKTESSKPKKHTRPPATPQPSRKSIKTTACMEKLSRNWNSRVFIILNKALNARDQDNIEEEGRILLKGINDLKDVPGEERLHEEFAWHLMGRQRQPNLILEFPEQHAESHYKQASKIILDEAEQHLLTALSIKLGESTFELPNNPEVWQEVADNYSLLFENSRDREAYLNGVDYIMRSIGHVRDRRTDVVEESGLQSTRRHRQAAYAQKRVVQTKPSRK